MNDFKSFFAGADAINSMRFNGYKNAAMALGELVDNSIQAGASKVTIVTEVQQIFGIKNKTKQIMRIGIVDNGSGMSDDILENCLRIGYGTRANTKGMGKYGVGLPNASISQCRLTEIWSWQNSLDSMKYTKLDISEDKWFSEGMEMPKPVKHDIDSYWLDYVDKTCNHGTIIIWSNLDLLKWKTPAALFKNSEFLIGRMYRYWLNTGAVSINMLIVDYNTHKIIDNLPFRAVDPLYLMKNTSVPDAPEDPMFELFNEDTFFLDDGNGNEQKVTIRGSVAKENIRCKKNGRDAGDLPYGKHASKNIGLSIVREDRELSLDSDWAHTISQINKPVNRWWGIEIKFGSELDRTFGVENNKQRANALKDVFYKDFCDFIEGDENDSDVRRRLKKEEPDLYNCLYTVDRLRKMTASLVKKVPPVTNISEDEKEGKKRRVIEKIVTDGTNKRVDDGNTSTSDSDIIKPLDIKINEMRDNLEVKGYDECEINDITNEIIDQGYRYVFRNRFVDTEAFFSVDTEVGNYIISLNKSHPLYNRLFGMFSEVDENKNSSADELKKIILDLYDSIKLMLASWARMEDEAKESRKNSIQHYRRTWGVVAKDLAGEDFIDEDDAF